jgi:hypothetical protein
MYDHQVKAGGVQYDDDEEDGPEDDPDDDGSVGDGEDGFELQDDQFAEEGVGGGYLYEVSFTSPQQLGMLLEVRGGGSGGGGGSLKNH